MKKLLNKVVLFLILSLTAFSYNFPIDDPYSATIIGSATMMTPGVSENIPLKVYEIQIKDKKDIPDIFSLTPSVIIEALPIIVAE